MTPSLRLSITIALAAGALTACLRGPITDDDADAVLGGGADAIAYRDITAHPGCSTAGLSYAPAAIAGFSCAAKDYTTAEDTSKPIVLLVHGNSDTPKGWEASVNDSCSPAGATQGVPMLAERLAAAGHRVYALDLRTDLVDDPSGNNETENAAKNMDHGWSVPLAQHFIGAVLAANPNRQVSLVGFSLGVTVIRDALRRLDVKNGAAPWAHIDDVVLLAGANHGVSTFALCGTNPTMRGEVACEMGDRAAFSPTPFLAALNGQLGAYEAPCSDGATAFGREACDGHVVTYTTIVMQDIPGGTQQDPFTSEASAALAGATNLTVGLNDFDSSDYFFCGFFKDHYGAARSLAALDLITATLGG